MGVGWGLGTSVGLALILGLWYWHANRPKPWNPSAVTAEFERIETEGRDESLVFCFVLENHTAQDYFVNGDAELMLDGKTKASNSLMLIEKDHGNLDFPIFVPQHNRSRVFVHLPDYKFPDSAAYSQKSEDDRKQYRKVLGKFVAEQIPNLDGFVIFDKASRYEIVLPPGWKN